MSFWKGSICFLCVAALSVSCKEEPQVLHESFLGKWTVLSAERDGRKDRSMDRGFIDFISKDSLISNFIGNPSGAVYVYDAPKLSVRTGGKPLRLTVSSVQNDTLQLASKIGKSTLKISLTRDPH